MQSFKNFQERLIYAFNKDNSQKTLPKGTLLLREGEVERNVYFISSGAVRVFLLTDVEEQTIRFGYKGSVINSLSSFLSAKPSEFYIEAMRKTVIAMITKERLLEIAYESQESLQQYTSLLEAVITQQIDREIDLLTISPSERLQRVLQRSPGLFQEVPLKYIASYLRMTPETLSRVRKNEL